MTGKCLCGAVSVTIDAKPDFIHDCNCTLCRKSGGAWGYFQGSHFRAEGETVCMMRNDKEEPAAEVHSCRTCQTTTHFVMAKSFTDKHGPIDMAGVNMRIFDAEELEGVEIRFPDGKNWPGTGEFGYRRSSETIGENYAW